MPLKTLTISQPIERESRIGRMLLDMEKISPEDAERVLRHQKDRGMRFGEAAQSLGFVTESDIQEALARQFDYPYLVNGEGTFPPELVAAYRPFSSEVESLRALRSQIMLRWFAEGHKNITVAGIDYDNRKTILLANLAVVFSQLGERTLIVDANLRRPEQHKIFKLPTKQGLSDILVGRAGRESISKVDSFISLSVLQAGTVPPNPQELLSRPRLKELSKELEQDFDVILYDAPAFSIAADVLPIAALTKGILLVAEKHKTRVATTSLVKEQLDRLHVTIVGSIMTEV